MRIDMRGVPVGFSSWPDFLSVLLKVPSALGCPAAAHLRVEQMIWTQQPASQRERQIGQMARLPKRRLMPVAGSIRPNNSEPGNPRTPRHRPMIKTIRIRLFSLNPCRPSRSPAEMQILDLVPWHVPSVFRGAGCWPSSCWTLEPHQRAL